MLTFNSLYDYFRQKFTFNFLDFLIRHATAILCFHL